MNNDEDEIELIEVQYKYYFPSEEGVIYILPHYQVFEPENGNPQCLVSETLGVRGMANTTWVEYAHFHLEPLSQEGRIYARASFLDLDIDSDNDNQLSYFPGTIEEEKLEQMPDALGKLIRLNSRDFDQDGVTNYYDWDGHMQNGFPHLRLTKSGYTATQETNMFFKFSYSFGETNDASSGHIRLWKKNGAQTRNPACAKDDGDLVRPNVEYTAADLNWSFITNGNTFTLYVEGTKTSDDAEPISAYMDPDGCGPVGYIAWDRVHYRVIDIEIEQTNIIALFDSTNNPYLSLVTNSWSHSIGWSINNWTQGFPLFCADITNQGVTNIWFDDHTYIDCNHHTGDYIVKAYVTNCSDCVDEMKLIIIKVDLDVNTDDHPKLSGTQIPTVSKETDITDADDSKEENPGGYLWVNDDNDNNTGGADVLLDMNDTTNYVDDDLERFKYDISQSVWDAGLKVRIESSFAAGSIKIWKKNKNEELAVSTDYTSKSTFDSDTDGILWLEGLKSGSGILTIKVLNGTTVVCEDKIKATVFAVSKVEWESDGDTTVEADIAPVGNNQKRIFPGKSTATDTKTRDKPRISVQLTPEIPAGSGWHVPVACLVRDVDHYAHAAIEGNMFDENSSSNDQEGHNNGYCPNDNRTGYTGTDDAAGGFGASGDAYNIGVEISAVAGDTVEASQSTATECYWSESIGGTGKGKAILHITHHTPCNNWRVVAGCAGAQACPWTKAKPVRINNLATDGVTMEYIDDSAVTVGTGGGTYSRSTKTLTVWRVLHLEQDHMGAVDFQEPASQNEWSVQDGNVTGGAGTATLATSCNAKYANQWQNGIAQFYKYNLPAKTFLAAGNITANTVGPNSSATFGANTPNDVNHVFVTDDDVSAFDDQNATGAATAKESPGVPDTALFNNADMLHAAAVHMLADTGKDSADVPFDLNITDKHATLATKKGLDGGDGYWVATAVVCYQEKVDSSNDPNFPGSGCTRGTSAPYWGTGAGKPSCGAFGTFVEAIRDWAANNGGAADSFQLRNRRTTLHECGHVMGGRHGDGGLMAGSTGTNPTGGAFSGLSLRRFMLLRDKGPGE